jgi:ferric-dicitrate binding protein FerR (iron transport regulator)
VNPEELIDGYLAGELSDAEQAELDALLRERPELARELADQQLLENALDVLHGDGTADEQVRLSVLSVIRGKTDDAFKTDLLKKVLAEDARKKREEAEFKLPTPPAGTSRPIPEPAIRRPRRRAWGAFTTAAAAAAAAALVAAGVVWFAGPSASPASTEGAFLLSASGGVRVVRGPETLSARPDMELLSGDRVTVPDGAEARLGFVDDTTRLDLRGPADLKFLQGGRGKKVELLRGALTSDFPRQDEAFVVATPHGEIRSDLGRLFVEIAPAFARLEVREGAAVLVKPDGKSIRVPADHYALAGKDVELAARPLVPGEPAAEKTEAVAVLRKVQGEVWLFTGSPADRVAARAGQGVLEGQSIFVDGARSGATLEFPDQTRLELGADTTVQRLVDPKDKLKKDVLLERGAVLADVTRQPADKPMWIRSAAAEVKVVGTRFLLAADGESAQVRVEEGVVRFRHVARKMEVEVQSGFQATVAPNAPFEAAPTPGGARYLRIDLKAGTPEGDGDWYADGRVLRQRKVSRDPASGASTHLFRVDAEEGVVLEALTEVAQVTPGAEAWGFGLAAVFQNRSIVLRSHQNTVGGSLFEFKDVTAIPFEHGREGRYRLKLRIERRPEGKSILRGKIWQGDREPDGWMIEDELELGGPLTHVGFQTVRCACAFDDFKVKVLKEEPR